MVVNELNAIACRHRRNKISGFEMGCVESESPAMHRIAEDARGSGSHLLAKINARFAWLLLVLLRRPRLRRINKPRGRTFDLQDHRVRAAVCQALNNVAFAPSARSRGSAGPIRAKPLHCQFDLPVRRHPIGSYEFFLVLCHLVPDNLYICRASRL
jgi:hypothetical protein